MSARTIIATASITKGGLHVQVILSPTDDPQDSKEPEDSEESDLTSVQEENLDILFVALRERLKQRKKAMCLDPGRISKLHRAWKKNRTESW